MTVTNPGDPSPRTCFHLCSSTPQDPDPIQPGRILVGQVPAGCQGQLVGLVPADAQPTCAGLHAHAVARHALQDPAGDPVGHRLTIVGCLRDRCPEDGDLAVVTGAEQSGHTDVQEAWVSGDGQVRESTFDTVTDSAGVSAARTVQVDDHRVTIEVSEVPGIGGVVDRQAQLDGAADRVGDEIRGARGSRGGGGGRVRHGSCGGKVEIRHLHLVTAGSFYVCSPVSAYMLWCLITSASHLLRTLHPEEPRNLNHYILRSLIHSGQLQDRINAL